MSKSIFLVPLLLIRLLISSILFLLTSIFFLFKNKLNNFFLSKLDKNFIFSKIQLKIPSEQIFDNFKISVNIVENLDIPRKKNQYLLDALYNDIIEVRYRKDGDRIFLDENHSKKVKEVFIEQKIPKDMRDRLPIFLYNNKIFWIYNVKKAYIPKINKNESKLIKVLITVEEVK